MQSQLQNVLHLLNNQNNVSPCVELERLVICFLFESQFMDFVWPTCSANLAKMSLPL